MRVYINLLLKKRTQINPQNNDLFRIHQLLLFLSGQASEKLYVTRASLLYYNCLSHNVITSISCGLRTLEEEIHIESDYIVKQTIRVEFAVRAQQSPIQMKKWQKPNIHRKFHLSCDLLTDRTFYEGSRVLREKQMFTFLSFIFQFLEGKYYHSSKRISS